MSESAQRKLTAIVSADVVGYTRLMQADETGTHARLKARFQDLVAPKIAAYDGRVVKLMGDGLLAEFPSVVNATTWAIELQRDIATANAGVSQEERIVYRVGLNLGDVIVDGDDLYGDGVNVAARLQEIAATGGLCLSDDAHRQVQGKVDVDFVDGGKVVLKNITNPVRAWRWSPEATDASAPPIEPRVLSLPDKPSIAVLPFDNMSGDTDQEYFSDGIVEGITAALSRIKTFFVIARTSAFSFKGKAISFDQIRDALGVQYFLEGSVQKAGDRVRITVQLIETTRGAHVWANTYDGTLADVFELQDTIIEQVAGAMHPSIRQAEIERSRSKQPNDLNAYDFAMRAMPSVWSLDRNDNRDALNLLTEAITIDPEYPLALSLAAWCYGQQAVYNWSDQLDKTKSEALRLAKNAASISSDDPFVLTVLGATYTIIDDHKSAEPLLERAVLLDPNSAWAWSRLGWAKTYIEKPDQAIEHFETALRLSPYDPMNFNCHIGMGAAYTVARDFDTAIQAFERGLNEHPQAVWAYRQLIPAYVGAGRMEEARAGVKILLETYPDLTSSKCKEAMVFSASEMDWLCGNLIKAGLPE